MKQYRFKVTFGQSYQYVRAASFNQLIKNTQNLSFEQGVADNLELNYYDNEMDQFLPISSEEEFSDIVSSAPDKANIELSVKRSSDGVSRVNTITS